MKTEDINLLTLAAKAASFKIEGISEYNFYVSDNVRTNLIWNPLNDNSDAFRLALNLGISIEADANIEVDTFTYDSITEGIYKRGCTAWYVLWNGSVIESQQVYDGDRCKATRLAIVTVAAELGKIE